jgi:hypothetical protein
MCGCGCFVLGEPKQTFAKLEMHEAPSAAPSSAGVAMGGRASSPRLLGKAHDDESRSA